MDILQVALVFLIALLSIFLAITGFQVFLILKDMKRTLDKLNEVLFFDKTEKVVTQRVMNAEVNSSAVEALKQNIKKTAKPSGPRFFKKTL